MLRLATIQDIPEIIQIINGAKKQLKDANIPQWQNGYPNEAVIQEDIQNGVAYVYLVDGKIAATAALIFDEEPSYTIIDEGEWLTTGNYATIHRIAVSQVLKKQGIAKKLFSDIIAFVQDQDVPAIRIDTHETNIPMLNLVNSVGFTHCGIIYIADEAGAPRKAFELVL